MVVTATFLSHRMLCVLPIGFIQTYESFILNLKGNFFDDLQTNFTCDGWAWKVIGNERAPYPKIVQSASPPRLLVTILLLPSHWGREKNTPSPWLGCLFPWMIDCRNLQCLVYTSSVFSYFAFASSWTMSKIPCLWGPFWPRRRSCLCIHGGSSPSRSLLLHPIVD